MQSAMSASRSRGSVCHRQRRAEEEAAEEEADQDSEEANGHDVDEDEDDLAGNALSKQRRAAGPVCCPTRPISKQCAECSVAATLSAVQVRRWDVSGMRTGQQHRSPENWCHVSRTLLLTTVPPRCCRD